MIKKILTVLIALAFIVSCSGGNGGDKPGTLSFNITDSKPTLPEGVVSVFITVDEMLVHQEGGNWVNLPMTETPFTIDLLQYTDGETAEIVPPIQLEAGKYTQLRMTVSDAFMRTLNDGKTEDIDLDVPSGKLRTDGTFDVSLDSKGFIDMVIDFDLSQSIVAQGNGKYKLKPVLHILEVNDAVIFEGVIDNTVFVGEEKPIVTVYDADGIIFTQVAVEKTVAPATESPWSVYWIVPDKDYKVEIDYDPTVANGPEFVKDITAASIPPGTTLLVE